MVKIETHRKLFFVSQYSNKNVCLFFTHKNIINLVRMWIRARIKYNFIFQVIYVIQKRNKKCLHLTKQNVYFRTALQQFKIT
jgi:hypothetical protein